MELIANVDVPRALRVSSTDSVGVMMCSAHRRVIFCRSVEDQSFTYHSPIAAFAGWLTVDSGFIELYVGCW